MYKAAIYKGVKNIEIRDMPDLECGDNDIIVKNLYAGVCGSDVTAYHHGGDSVRIFADSEFGHEMVSEIVTAGKNVTDVRVGDLIYPFPATYRGSSARAATVGGFSQYIQIPDVKVGYNIFPVDKEISTRVASMVEPFTVGTHSAKVAKPQVGQKAIVFGAGVIGLSAAIALDYYGVEKIMVVDIADYRLDKAAALGFFTCNSANEDLKEKATAELGAGVGLFGAAVDADIFIDATGVAEVIKTFQAIGKRYATLSVVGVHHAPRELNLMALTYSGQTIVGSPGYDFEDVGIVFEIMKAKKFDLDSLITGEYPLEEVEQAILTASDPERSVKVVVKY